MQLRLTLFHVSVLAFGVFFIFSLPWLFPSSAPTHSDSYNLGFNNKISLIGVILTIVGLAVCHMSTRQRTYSQAWRDAFVGLLSHQKVSVFEYCVPAILASVFSAASWYLYSILPSYAYGEIAYTLSRLDLLLMGGIPYDGVQWNYGPLYLYLPAAMVWVSHYTLDPDIAYMISLVAFNFANSLLTYWVISQFALNRKQRIFIFLVTNLCFNLALSPYGSVRFIAPYAMLFIVHHLNTKRDFNSRRNRIFFTIICILSLLLCFSISPEIGICSSIAMVVYLLMCVRAGQKWHTANLIIAPVVSVLIVSLLSVKYIESVFAFSSGGGNFPVFPTAHVLFYLGSLFFLLPLILSTCWKARDTTDALLIGFSVSIVVLSAPALGRCDAVHIMLNGFGVFLLCIALSLKERKPFVLYPACYILLFTVGQSIIHWVEYRDRLFAVWHFHQLGVEKTQRNFLRTERLQLTPEINMVGKLLLPYQRIGTPLRTDENMEFALKYHRLYVPEYHASPFLEINTVAQLRRKLQEVSHMKYILIRDTDWKTSDLNLQQYSRGRADYLSFLLAYPVNYELSKKPFLPEREIAKYIRQNFRVVRHLNSHVLLQNKKPVEFTK